MLNEYNGAVTFLLQMNVLSGAEEVTSWIKDRSARATYDFEEEKKLAALSGSYRPTKLRQLLSRSSRIAKVR